LINDYNKIADIKKESAEINTIKNIDSTETSKNTESIDINKESEILSQANGITDINNETGSTQPIQRTEYIEKSIKQIKLLMPRIKIKKLKKSLINVMMIKK